MKKIIFLLLIVASSVFAGSQTVTVPGVVGEYGGLSCGSSYDYTTTSSSSQSNCEAVGIVYPTNRVGTVGCTSKLYYVPAGCNQSNGYALFTETRDVTGTWTCPASSTCSPGQVMNEETCTCKCSPPPSQYGLLFETLETPESCTLINALLSLEDGDTNTISSVYWDSCNAQCLGELQPCPCGQSIKNGQCMNVEPPAGSCPSGNITFQTHENLIEPNCARFWFCDGYATAFFSSNVGCCLGNDGTSDSNSTNPDSNSTNPDSNSSDPFDPSDPGDSGENGEEDGGETGGGDSNTSNPAPGGGDSNTSTPVPGGGDSNTTSDSNSSAPGEYEDSDEDKDGKGKIANALDDAYSTLDKIKSDYERIMNALENGVTPISITSGQAPQFCATVFGKQICINLCDSFGYFYSIFYYIFLILFTVMALHIYYTAFKMR